MNKIVLFASVLIMMTACKHKQEIAHIDRPNLEPIQNSVNNPHVPNTPEYSKEEMSQIEFDDTNFDFGNISKKNGKVSHWYVFKNSGSKPLMISVKPSCGCTVGKSPKDPIAPGAKDSIQLEYDPAHDSGERMKTATVTGNFEKPVKLIFKANVGE